MHSRQNFGVDRYGQDAKKARKLERGDKGNNKTKYRIR